MDDAYIRISDSLKLLEKKKIQYNLKSFLVALVIITVVLVLVALPYSLMQFYGSKIMNVVIFINGIILTFLSIIIVVWWMSYKRTGKRIEAFQRILKENVFVKGKRGVIKP